MKKIIMKSLDKIASFSLIIAVLAAGTASYWGGCQPKEPDLEFLKDKKQSVH